MKTKRKGSSFQSMSSKRKLESIFLFTTGKCNAKCAMCFYADDMDMKAPDMTFDELRKISETAGQINRLWLSGGEPTLRDDLPEIIEMFYKNNQIKDINLPTNGLRGERVIEWIKRLRESCPELNLTVSVSLDGFGKTHDLQRGVPGNFYKAVDTLKKIHDNFHEDGRVLKNIATVVTKYNLEEIIDFMMWCFGRLHVSTQTIEAARGMTREDGVKVLTEQTLRELQDKIVPFYAAYADRMAEGVTEFRKRVTRFFYLGFIRSTYNIRASNIDKPTPWGMDCTAGETTLVLDYDGRFRACELREPIGNIKDYDCDVQAIINSDAMKNEIKEIGYGYAANCWCTHGCWIMSSMVFNPGKMISKIYKGYRESKKLSKPLDIHPQLLVDLETKYDLDREKLAEIGIA